MGYSNAGDALTLTLSQRERELGCSPWLQFSRNTIMKGTAGKSLGLAIAQAGVENVP